MSLPHPRRHRSRIQPLLPGTAGEQCGHGDTVTREQCGHGDTVTHESLSPNELPRGFSIESAAQTQLLQPRPEDARGLHRGAAFPRGYPQPRSLLL